jgi:hypothetical protein
MLVFILRTMKSCAEPKDGASQTDRDGIDDVAINPVTRVVDGDRDPLIHEMASPAGSIHHGHTDSGRRRTRVSAVHGSCTPSRAPLRYSGGVHNACHDIDVIVDQHDIGSMFMDGESQM